MTKFFLFLYNELHFILNIQYPSISYIWIVTHICLQKNVVILLTAVTDSTILAAHDTLSFTYTLTITKYNIPSLLHWL